MALQKWEVQISCETFEDLEKDIWTVEVNDNEVTIVLNNRRRQWEILTDQDGFIVDRCDTLETAIGEAFYSLIQDDE